MLSDEEDYHDIFITQEVKSKFENDASLEEDMEYKTFRDPQYSDISDNEEAEREKRIG